MAETTLAMAPETHKEACAKTPQASCNLPIECNKMAVGDHQIMMSALEAQTEHMEQTRYLTTLLGLANRGVWDTGQRAD